MAEAGFTVDTDVLVDVFRGYAPALAWLGHQKDAVVGVPVIVRMEVLQGARNRRDESTIRRRLDEFTVLHLQTGDSELAERWFRQFHLSHGLGILDCLIAAIAVRQRVPFFTFNAKHFSVLPQLDAHAPYSR